MKPWHPTSSKFMRIDKDANKLGNLWLIVRFCELFVFSLITENILSSAFLFSLQEMRFVMLCENFYFLSLYLWAPPVQSSEFLR